MMYNGNAYEYTGKYYSILENKRQIYDKLYMEVLKGEKIDLEAFYCYVKEDGIETDFIYIDNFLLCLTISIKLKELLEKFNIGNCRFIPIYLEDSNNLIGYLVNVLNVFDRTCLDLEHSKRGPKIFEEADIIKPSFNNDIIGDLDLFTYKFNGDLTSGIFISERLKRAIKKAKLTGCGFIYCESYK